MTLQDFIAQQGRPLSASRGEHLFHQGEPDQSIYVLKEGLLKAYYLSADGREHIKSFLLPGDLIGSLTACTSTAGCSFSLLCLEDSELICIDFDKITQNGQNDLTTANQIIDFLLAFGIKKETREFELLCLPAEDRYRQLLKTAPSLFDRVTQNDIARYLGITPVGLSRIKKRVTGA